MQTIGKQICTAPEQIVFAGPYWLITTPIHTKLKPNLKNFLKTNYNGNNLYMLLRFITFI
jgi:hypothetical protein